MRILVENPVDFPPRNVASLSCAVCGIFVGDLRDASRTRERMKVVEEPISVLRDYGEAELTLLMGGYRLAMTSQEARRLVHIVHAALTEAAGEGGRPQGDGVASGSPDHAAIVAKVAEQVISWSQIAAAQRK